MSAVFPPISSKNTDATVTNKDVSVFERKVSGIQKGVSGLNAQVKQVVQWSEDMKQVLAAVIATQKNLEIAAMKSTEVDLKKAVAELVNKVNEDLRMVPSILEKISTSFDSSFKDLSKLVTEEISSSASDLTDFIDSTSKRTEGIIVKLLESFENLTAFMVDNTSNSKIYAVLNAISETADTNKSLLALINDDLFLLKESIANLTKLNKEPICNDREYWYGRDSETGYLSNSSITGWDFSVDTIGKFGEPVQISDSNTLPIKRILVSYANISNKVYKIRFYHGPTFEKSSVLTEVLFIKSGSSFGSSPIVVNAPKISPKDKVWCAITCEITPANLGLLLSM
jgi:hypothetical protein